MSFEVTIQSSGHKFSAEAQESLLEAALRSGMNVNYNCSSGSCGDCKAKIIQGNTAVFQNHDYPLTEAEKIQGYILLCSVKAQSNLIINVSEALQPQDIPQQNITVKVAKIERLNDYNLVLHLRTPRSKTLRFIAGQGIDLLLAGFPPLSLAIASCPCNGMVLQFHLQRDHPHPAVEYIFNQLKPFDSIQLSGPFGDFTLDETSNRAIVMIAEGTGLAPIKSLIEHAIALDLAQSMYLFWLVDDGQSHYLSNYCRSWELALDCFVYIPLLLQQNSVSVSQAYEKCMLDVLARCPIESEVDLYLAGSELMLKAFSSGFNARGTPPNRIKQAYIS